jgi:hypothetical protein
MSSQRYERVRFLLEPQLATQSPTKASIRQTNINANYFHEQVSAHDDDTLTSPQIPNSPPPSFRSRASSPTSRHNEPVDQNLADTFDADGSDSDEENDGDDRQRLMRGTPSSSSAEQIHTPATTTTTDGERPPPLIERRATYLPVFAPTTTGRVYGGGSASDGVFANLSAKPEMGEKTEEHPPVSSPSRSLVPRISILMEYRHTNKQQQMPHHPTGKQQSLHPASVAQTKSTSKASPSAPSSPSSGTA